MMNVLQKTGSDSHPVSELVSGVAGVQLPVAGEASPSWSCFGSRITGARGPMMIVTMAPGEVAKIISGTKTEFRRHRQFSKINLNSDGWSLIWSGTDDDGSEMIEMDSHRGECKVIKCSYGGVGHVLAVVESWHMDADGACYFKESPEDNRFHWNPSITLPLEMARARIKIESVTAQRIGDMTEQNAINEGVTVPRGTSGWPDNASHPLVPTGLENRTRTHLAAYYHHWDDMNHTDGTRHGCECAAYKNPWCWALKCSLVV